MENFIIHLFAFFGVILGSGVLVALLPSILSILPGEKKEYYTIVEPPVQAVKTEIVAQPVVRVINTERVIESVKREPCVESEWIEANDVQTGEWGSKDIDLAVAFEMTSYENVYETIEMPESYTQVSEIDATLALIKQIDAILAQAEKVITLANEFDMACNAKVEIEDEEDAFAHIDNDESDHPDTCVCFVCAPFGITPMGSKISKVKANTQALLQDLDTIGNPDRADAFYSRGYKSTDSDLPPGFYDDDNLAQDWYDNQLYV